MKKLLLLSILTSTLAYSQITDENASNAANSGGTNLSGNIGVGVTPSSSSPYKLEVNGAGRYSSNLLVGDPNGARTEINTSTNHKIFAPTNIKTIDLDGNYQGGGFVGVYRADIFNNPVAMHAAVNKKTYSLKVDKYTDNGVYADGAKLISLLDTGDSEALTGLQLNTTNSVIIIGSWIGYEKNKGYGLVNRFKTKLENDLYIETGNLGIGTNSFVDGSDIYRLSVEGRIRAHAVKVYTDWADFVFDENYKLSSLAEVEKYISENGHLKDIPNAKQVEENGIELGEMNKLLLQKIEELTLYVIQLNKELEILKSKNDKL